jgi:hypothetical protein
MDMTRKGMEGDQMEDNMIDELCGRDHYIQYANAITDFDLNQLHVDELFDTMKDDLKLLRCCNQYSYLARMNGTADMSPAAHS